MEGFMPQSTQCLSCKHYLGGFNNGMYCNAFPFEKGKSIPYEIFSGKFDHRNKHKDDNGILWPPALAPFYVGLINLNVRDQASSQMSREVYQKLTNAGVEVLYDDRKERAGVKFADMDLIGLPLQLIVGPRGITNDEVELKERKTGKIMKMSLEKALKKILDGKR